MGRGIVGRLGGLEDVFRFFFFCDMSWSFYMHFCRANKSIYPGLTIFVRKIGSLISFEKISTHLTP